MSFIAIEPKHPGLAASKSGAIRVAQAVPVLLRGQCTIEIAASNGLRMMIGMVI